MVKQSHIDQRQGFFQALREHLVSLARLWISAWMVVREDDRTGIVMQRALHDFAGIDGGMIDRAPILDLVEDQLVAVVEIQHAKLLARLVLQAEPDIGQERGPGRDDRSVDGLLTRDAAGDQLPLVLLSFMSESRRLHNQRMKTELGLRLRYPTVADGLSG